jgi:transposase
MAVAVQQIYPVAHLPLMLGVLRRLEVATVIDRLIPPHPEHVLSTGRGVEALVLAILDGAHALYKVGQRLEERGMLDLLQPGLTRASLHDYRLGRILDALCAATLNTVLSAMALKTLEGYAIPTPWLHQDTTTMALYGAYEDEPQTPGAPRPAYGHSKDGRNDLKQVLLSLGVSGDGGVPCGLACVMASAATVWKPRWRLRSAWPWAWKACGGSWRRVKHTVVGHWGYVSNAGWA